MEIENTIRMLISFWSNQNILSNELSSEQIMSIEKKNNIFLPSDFRNYFGLVNGMKSLYPNYIDNEGFLFYPIEKLLTVKEEFKGLNSQYSDMIVFGEYMHKSWWYVINILKNDAYEIGIMPNFNTYKPITTSLNEFLLLYINDSEILYNV